MFILLVHLILGTQPWCAYNKIENTIQCNYETKYQCESYRDNNEVCILNPNLK